MKHQFATGRLLSRIYAEVVRFCVRYYCSSEDGLKHMEECVWSYTKTTTWVCVHVYTRVCTQTHRVEASLGFVIHEHLVPVLDES